MRECGVQCVLIIMGLLESYRIDRPLERLLATADIAGHKKDLEALRRHPGKATQRIFERLQATRNRSTFRRLQLILYHLLDHDTASEVAAGLNSSDEKIRKAAIAVLKRSRDFNPNTLLELMDETGAPNAEILDVLAGHKDRVNAAELLTAAERLPAAHLRTAFALLDEILTPALESYLLERLASPSVAFRVQVTAILHRFPSPPVIRALERQLEDRATDVRFHALDSLRRIPGKVRLEAILPLLQDSNLGVQTLAIDAFATHHRGQQTLALLLPLLRDPSAYVRRAAVEVLNAIADRAILNQLIRSLQDEDWWSRQRASDALAKVGGPRVAAAMTELIRSDDEVMRRMAVEVINSTRDPRAFDDIVTALDDPDWWVRERAIDTLAVMGDARAEGILLAKLERDEDARPTTLRALAIIRSDTLLESIYPWVEASQPLVRVEALRAVEALANEQQAEVAAGRVEAMLAAQTDERSQAEAQRVLRTLRARAGHDSAAGLGGDGETTQTTIARPSLPAERMRSADPIDLRALEPGTVFDDRYRLVAWLGSGAFGEVAQFEDMTVEDQVVFKFLNARYARDEDIKQRFVQELRVARQVTHPNVIRIYDFIRLGGEFAISMEYFDGYPLDREFLHGRGMRSERAIRLLREVTFGMEAAHNAGVIHRDLKPGNILMNALGDVKIVDFGIAAAARDGRTPDTAERGRFVGTPAYAAPEQIRGQHPDARADIYSLGVVAYRMLTGRLPYESRDSKEVLKGHLRGDAPTVDELNPDIGSELSGIVRRSMRLDPADRWPAMADLRVELDRLGR